MITQLYRKFIPRKLRDLIYRKILKKPLQFKRNYPIAKKVIEYYNDKIIDTEQIKCIDFLKKHHLFLTVDRLIYMNSFVDKYQNLKVDLNYDKSKALYYVMHKGKRLYWQKGVVEEEIKDAYRRLLMEQDVDSPHRYWLNKSDFKNEILFDVGSAEGIIALEHIEDLKQVYLFECSEEWTQPLKATFEPYKEKVTFVEKYVSDTTNQLKNTTTLDDFVQTEKCDVSIIKMDIEGFEEQALEGAKEILSNRKIKIAACAYHRPSAEKNILNYYHQYGLTNIQINPGFINYFYSKEIPYLRRGVIRAERK